jgi:hypothetical protein
MIARIWRGVVRTEYAETPGNRGAQISASTRTGAPSASPSTWGTRASPVQGFAGEDDRLAEREHTVKHYEIVYSVEPD